MFRQGKFTHTVLWSFGQRPSAFLAEAKSEARRLCWYKLDELDRS